MTLDPALWIDLAVVLGYFGLIGWIGLRLGSREDTIESFALGGRQMPWWAVLGSIIAAETSAGTFLGTPAEGYELRNYTYLQLALGTILARVIVAFVFLKPFYYYRVYSIYEFLTVRFGVGTKNAASAVFLVTRVLASGARLYISAIILAVGAQMVMGRPLSSTEQLSIYVGAVTVMTILTALYTSIGGIKAVIWTDLFQATLMIGSALCAIGWIIGRLPGSWSGLGEHLPRWTLSSFVTLGTDQQLNFGQNVQQVLSTDYTLWAALIGSTFITLATHGTDQDMVQRMLTAKDYQRSRLSLLWSGLADVPIVFIFLSIGILLSIYYQLRPDPQLPVKTNEVFAYFILRELPAGFRGLLIAGVFATAMGSLSSALNALATTFTRDWYRRDSTASPGSASAVQVARLSTVGFGALMIGVASATAYFVILHPHSRIIPLALGMFGYTYGSLLGVFLLGMLTRTRGSDSGNRIAMLMGFLVVAVVSRLPNDLAQLFGLPMIQYPDWLVLVAFPWRIFIGSVVTFMVGLCFASPPQSLEARRSFPASGTALET